MSQDTNAAVPSEISREEENQRAMATLLQELDIPKAFFSKGIAAFMNIASRIYTARVANLPVHLVTPQYVRDSFILAFLFQDQEAKVAALLLAESEKPGEITLAEFTKLLDTVIPAEVVNASQLQMPFVAPTNQQAASAYTSQGLPKSHVETAPGVVSEKLHVTPVEPVPGGRQESNQNDFLGPARTPVGGVVTELKGNTTAEPSRFDSRQ